MIESIAAVVLLGFVFLLGTIICVHEDKSVSVVASKQSSRNVVKPNHTKIELKSKMESKGEQLNEVKVVDTKVDTDSVKQVDLNEISTMYKQNIQKRIDAAKKGRDRVLLIDNYEYQLAMTGSMKNSMIVHSTCSNASQSKSLTVPMPSSTVCAVSTISFVPNSVASSSKSYSEANKVIESVSKPSQLEQQAVELKKTHNSVSIVGSAKSDAHLHVPSKGKIMNDKANQMKKVQNPVLSVTDLKRDSKTTAAPSSSTRSSNEKLKQSLSKISCKVPSQINKTKSLFVGSEVSNSGVTNANSVN